MADQQHTAVINALLAVAATAFHLCDNTENDGKTRTVDDFDFQALSDALDKLDELPDAQPGYIMEGPAKASWALRGLLAAAGVTAPSVTDAMALAFHRATTDGSIGQEDVDTIKAGLQAVFAAYGVAPSDGGQQK